ncbi:glycosyltransferase [Fulvimarina sp. MAC3]|uniref:glycosyltransferase n=1 Tax=Fulvimarina sp. MAC3 TaxID=3148887 RepID=UPI0031FBD902
MDGLRSPLSTMRVALVHYWLVEMRGGEKVLEAFARMFPNADIFTLVCDHDKLSPTLRRHRVTTSFLQKIPGATKSYTQLLPLMPFALEQFDLRSYDLVISSESGPAKGVVTRPDAFHLCYCHTPMRYMWDHYHEYYESAGRLARIGMSLTGPLIRNWDVNSAARVDHFVANSNHVARRIRRYWRRNAEVIYPPVAVDHFTPGTAKSDFYLVAGQLVSYKRVDLAVRAFTAMNKKLVVIGGGPEEKFLRNIAGPSVSFLGRQPDHVLKDHFQRCRALVFPGEEDFGIVPVEAMAAGRPVIGYARGGLLETVSSPEYGTLFDEQSVEALTNAVESFEKREPSFDPAAIRRGAMRFDEASFERRIRQTLERRLFPDHAGDEAVFDARSGDVRATSSREPRMAAIHE